MHFLTPTHTLTPPTHPPDMNNHTHPRALVNALENARRNLSAQIAQLAHVQRTLDVRDPYDVLDDRHKDAVSAVASAASALRGAMQNITENMRTRGSWGVFREWPQFHTNSVAPGGRTLVESTPYKWYMDRPFAAGENAWTPDEPTCFHLQQTIVGALLKEISVEYSVSVQQRVLGRAERGAPERTYASACDTIRHHRALQSPHLFDALIRTVPPLEYVRQLADSSEMRVVPHVPERLHAALPAVVARYTGVTLQFADSGHGTTISAIAMCYVRDCHLESYPPTTIDVESQRLMLFSWVTANCGFKGPVLRVFSNTTSLGCVRACKIIMWAAHMLALVVRAIVFGRPDDRVEAYHAKFRDVVRMLIPLGIDETSVEILLTQGTELWARFDDEMSYCLSLTSIRALIRRITERTRAPAPGSEGVNARTTILVSALKDVLDVFILCCGAMSRRLLCNVAFEAMESVHRENGAL